MRVLVTGGSGVVGDAAVRALLAHGHRVRLLARHASDDARAWPAPGDADAPGGPRSGAGVEAHDGDVTDPATLDGAARGCDVVLHLVGTVTERPPAVTYARVNVEGTRHMVDEAARAGVPRFVYVSSLGADRGSSPYHQSKFAGEQETARFPGAWTVVRLANVYGPGDAVVSLLLRMVRALPALPLLGGGDLEFQPLWTDDCGEALARACERDDLAGAALDVAGDERTSMRDLLDRFARLTERAPLRIPMPLPIATLGVKLADAAGVDLGINESQLTMLAEGNVIDPPRENALTGVFGVTATSLDEGLRRLLDELPEQLPAAGLGALHHKRYWAEVAAPREPAAALFRRFCTRFHALTPTAMDLTAEPDTPTAVLSLHQTVTMALPLRGNVQVRVAALDDERPGARSLTLQTVEGHPLAGAVRFTFTEDGDGEGTRPFRFEVEVYERAADPFDWVAMMLLGSRLQRANWREMVRMVIEESGGQGGIEEAEETLEGEAAEQVERWLKELAIERARADNGARLGEGAGSRVSGGVRFDGAEAM